ncbi:MAG: hypothetical protein ABIZ56_08480 [Chthoniobacteraceae bacterium]
MLPLAGPQFPDSLEGLITALRSGFGNRGISARDVRATGEWPRIAELSIDLTDAQFSRAMDLPKSATESQPGVSVESLTISAAPFFFEKTPAHLDLRATKAECGFARDAMGEAFLKLLRTEGGSISIEAQRADLESTLRNFAESFLAKQGAQVKSAHLELIDRGPRSLGFRAEITAKAFVMTARVAVTGQLDLDDQLNLRVRDLATSGDGMIANLASGFLRPRFAEIEKRTIPLAAYSFAGVTLHGARLSGGNSLRIDAQFGV